MDGLRKSEDGRALLKSSLENLVLLLSPFSSHLCEELWERMGHKSSLVQTPWPSFDPNLAREEKVTIVVQVNGKLRSKFEAEMDSDEDQVKEMALGLGRIQKLLAGQKPKKVIYVKNKLVNIVI
jgi:leucyl-tRNA synthetase